MKTVKTSTNPISAPSNFRSLPAKVVTKDGDGLFGASHGSGVASSITCGVCGNQAGNLEIYANWGFSYPNGNSWDDREIVCGGCGQFTLELQFTEG